MDGLCFADRGGLPDAEDRERSTRGFLSFFRYGEFSGESEGNEVRDLSVSAVVGVLWLFEAADDSFLGFVRLWFDVLLLAEVVLLLRESVCCLLPLSTLAITQS